MRAALILLALAACADPDAPHLGLGVGVGPTGVRVTPSVSTRLGPTSLGVSPHGAAVGTGYRNLGLSVGGAF